MRKMIGFVPPSPWLTLDGVRSLQIAVSIALAAEAHVVEFLAGVALIGPGPRGVC